MSTDNGERVAAQVASTSDPSGSTTAALVACQKCLDACTHNYAPCPLCPPCEHARPRVARSVIRDDLDPFDPPAECLTCGVPVPPREQWQVVSVDGTPYYKVPDGLITQALTEWAYCEPCFRARMAGVAGRRDDAHE